MIELTPGQHIHLIGIGGAGLSAIARILLQRGFVVSGSDLTPSEATAALEAEGARIFPGHDAAFVDGADLVLASSAIAAGHVEARAAKDCGIPICDRREFMTALLDGFRTIAVAGTHGKTTTTSMIAHILRQAGIDPSYIVGGTMGNTGRNAAIGSSDIFVIEADEYGHMFLGLRPEIAVVTNIEHEHPDYFRTPEAHFGAFASFVELLPPTGLLVSCADDERARALLDNRRASGMPAASYGIAEDAAEWRAVDIRSCGQRTTATILRRDKALGSFTLDLPGAHNLLNALAAAIVANACGVSFDESAAALRSFKPTARRFEIRGAREDVIVIDDYAHHPTEIRVNLSAARERYPQHQIWAIWQPHTYSRAQAFWSAFTSAFAAADHVLITPIYAAREAPLAGITGPALVDDMGSHPSVRYAPTFEAAADRLRDDIKGPAVVLICSAGDANKIADLFLSRDATN